LEGREKNRVDQSGGAGFPFEVSSTSDNECTLRIPHSESWLNYQHRNVVFPELVFLTLPAIISYNHYFRRVLLPISLYWKTIN